VDTRRRLVRAAARLWAERGYEAVAVDEICAASGVGRSTYYLHFESKEQLLRELTFATARGVADDVERSVVAGSLHQQLETFVGGLVRRMESVPKTLAALTMRHTTGGMATPQPSAERHVLFDDTLTEIVQAAQHRGELRADVDPREIGDVLGGMVLEALQRWSSDRARLSLHDNLWLRITLVLDGLLAENSELTTGDLPAVGALAPSVPDDFEGTG
jgi:AcrR family transcriptional regulator